MDVKELYERAQYLQHTEKDYVKALEIYQEIIENYPSTQEAYYSEISIKDISDEMGCTNQDIHFIKEQQKHILEEKEYKERLDSLIITTTNNIDGFITKKYIDIESVEIVIGTGIISEFTTEIQDAFGMRSTAFEKKLQNAKQIAFENLKKLAAKKGGNAIVGIKIAYTEFGNNRIGLIVSGTIVEVEKIN